jgi:hypothetical protein
MLNFSSTGMSSFPSKIAFLFAKPLHQGHLRLPLSTILFVRFFFATLAVIPELTVSRGMAASNHFLT